MKPVDARSDPRNVFAAVPFMALLGARREFAQDGRSRLSIDATPQLGNVIGAMHGGVVATLLDVAMASAAVSIIDFARTVVTLNMDTSFVSPGRGTLHADGEVIEHDAEMAYCRAFVRDAQGQLVAMAQGSFRYLALP